MSPAYLTYNGLLLYQRFPAAFRQPLNYEGRRKFN